MKTANCNRVSWNEEGLLINSDTFYWREIFIMPDDRGSPFVSATQFIGPPVQNQVVFNRDSKQSLAIIAVDDQVWLIKFLEAVEQYGRL